MTTPTNAFNIIQPTINFGIIGCVSSGKSTLLNSLFCDTYSDMKIKRTTMIPQVYQCDPKIQKNKTYAKEIRKQNEEINKKIIEQTENKTALTIQDCYEIVYKVPPINNFIKLPPNINVAIFDIPGLNDSQTKNTYFEYLNQNFYKFDYILFVIDIQSALNTSDEMDILHLIKNNILDIKKKYNKDIKLLVICNKCDNMELNKNGILEMDEPELEEMYEQIIKTLKNELSIINYDIIKYSAEDTYVYRLLTEGHSLDQKYIDRLGINELGKIKWKELKTNSSINELVKILKDLINIDERLKNTGYAGLIDKINKGIDTSSTILLNKVNIIEEIILKKEQDLTKVNILFDSIYKYVKEIQSFEKTIDINSILNSIKLFWHNILFTKFLFDTIDITNHTDIKKNYYETLIKQQETYKGIEFKSFVESYINKETDYFVLNLDTIINDTYSFDKIIDTFQNIYNNNNKKLPIDKLMKSIYKIPIYDIHNLIVSLTELFFIDYEETCTIYMNYYKNYKNYYDNSYTQIRHIGLCSLHNMYIKEYISTNNINYNILSIIVNHYNIIYRSRNTDITNFDYTDKNLEKEIESFLKPFKIFINYMNNPEFQAFLDLKRKIAETLKVSNCPKVDKIACAILKEIKEEYKDMSIVDRFKKAFELFNSNVSKYEVVEPLTIVIS
jgi:predicted GTPase